MKLEYYEVFMYTFSYADDNKHSEITFDEGTVCFQNRALDSFLLTGKNKRLF